MRFCAISLALLFVGCVTVPPPASLHQLEEMTFDERSDQAKKQAPGAWSEVERYLKQAHEALNDGNLDQAQRFAVLGIIQAKIALADIAQVEAGDRLAEAAERHRELETRKERIAQQFEQTLKELERTRIREHLERVVEKTRRRAAVAEELGEGRLAPDDRAELGDARVQVGREMIARARVWIGILEALVVGNSIPRERVMLVTGAMKMAQDRLLRGGLAGVQEQVETIGVEARRIFAQVWRGDANSENSNLTDLADALDAAGFDMSNEEFGRAIRFGGGARPARARKTVDRRLNDFGRIVAATDRIQLVILVSTGSHDAAALAEKSSRKRGVQVRRILERNGVSRERIVVSECGAATPLVSMRGGSERIAILIVPLP
jgi:hypothetical protein